MNLIISFIINITQIAGRIVPALATTTALVAGLVTLELVKIATERVMRRREQADTSITGGDTTIEADRLLTKFRNSFVNLARPLLAFAQPVEAESFTVNSRTFNMWNVLQVHLILNNVILHKFLLTE